MPQPVLDYAPPKEFDTGLFVAPALKRHSPTARHLLLVFGAFGLCLCGYLVVHTMVYGTSHVTVYFGKQFHNPAPWQAITIAVAVGIVIGVPFFRAALRSCEASIQEIR